jgi:putative ABC transport system ATP-binding protein
MNPDLVLQVERVGKTVETVDGSLRILHDISFEVFSGETLAIVGASGSGKTTLLSILAGLDSPSDGHVSLMGIDLSQASETARALLRQKHVGFVFQSFQLVDYLNALENVQLPLEISGVPLSIAQKKAEDALRQVGLAHRLSHFPKTLSGGEQQRVALARACVGEPRILFADEPTGSLDEESGGVIIDLLFEMNRRLGSTLILVTHDPNLASRCARQIKLVRGLIDT